jgi:hypothetical protein
MHVEIVPPPVLNNAERQKNKDFKDETLYD